MNKLAEFILKYKYFIVAVTTLLTLFFGYTLKDLKVNADLLSYLPENDSTSILFYEIGKNYGGNDKADRIFILKGQAPYDNHWEPGFRILLIYEPDKEIDR